MGTETCGGQLVGARGEDTPGETGPAGTAGDSSPATVTFPAETAEDPLPAATGEGSKKRAVTIKARSQDSRFQGFMITYEEAKI
jgi:hypothetical protein